MSILIINALEEFKDRTQRFHSAYHLVNTALSEFAEKIRIENEGIKFEKHIIEYENEVITSVPYSLILMGLKYDGPISQVVAHGILNWIYAAWDNCFRKKISEELGVDVNIVMSDVMGDIRILRNAISHDFGFIFADLKKLKELTWFPEGKIILKAEDMNKIQRKINNMSIYIKYA